MDGEKANCVFTDPPYGVDIQERDLAQAEVRGRRKRVATFCCAIPQTRVLALAVRRRTRVELGIEILARTTWPWATETSDCVAVATPQ